jgi:protein arginine N-methyltransferase 1
MSCIKPSVLSEPLIDICDKEAINSSHCKIFEVDLYTCTKADLDFSSSYELTFFRNDTLHGLIAWFDIFFDKLPNKVKFTTDPYTRPTHWKQVIFYTTQDIFVEKGKFKLTTR